MVGGLGCPICLECPHHNLGQDPKRVRPPSSR